MSASSVFITSGACSTRATFKAAQRHGFRHFQSDVAAADDHHLFGIGQVQFALNVDGALQAVDTKNPVGVNARKIRTNRSRSGADHQLVIGLPVFQAALYLANAQALTSGVDFQHFIADFDFNVLLFFKFFGGPGNQVLDVADNLADIVGDASSRIGRVSTTLVGDDFQL